MSRRMERDKQIDQATVSRPLGSMNKVDRESLTRRDRYLDPMFAGS